MKRAILTTIAALGLDLGASAATITQWDFNDNPSDANPTTGTLVPATGTGTAVTVGGLPTSYNAANALSSDPLGSDTNNAAWRMASGWPVQGTGNKTCGVQFNLSTVGYQNITLMWDQANSANASRYYRVQYSVDNGATWVDKDLFDNNTGGTSWMNNNSVSFATTPGASGNPNFGVRIVSEFQSTAVGGLPNYIAVNAGAYAVSGVLRLDMVTFSADPISGPVQISGNPTDQTVAVGQPVALNVVAGGGSGTLTYQWRKNHSAIPGATNAIYSIAAVQLGDAGSYEVIVGDGVNSVTSDPPASLTVRTPQGLAWTGESNNSWNFYDVNWVDTTSLVHGAYAEGDQVLFDSRGAANPSVSLANSFTPSSVTVNASFDYTLSGAPITGAAGLTKRGSGTLSVDNDNTYTGPTVIESGVVQVGQADTHGVLGTGPITNNSALVFNRTDTYTVPNNIRSSGAITNFNTTATVILSGSNVYNGPVVAAAGILTLAGTVNSPDLFSLATVPGGSAGGLGTRLYLAGGVVVGSGTTVHLSGTTSVNDLRAGVGASTGINEINGPIILDGTGNNQFFSDAGATLRLNGTISGAPGFAGGVLLGSGGSGAGVLNGTINLPGRTVNKWDAGLWIVNSTGNSWANTQIRTGTLRLGANNALPTGLALTAAPSGQTAYFDLAGFNQEVASYNTAGGTGIVTNSSPTSNSTFTIGSGATSYRFDDSATGGKLNLTFKGTYKIAGNVTYHGDTTVLTGGTLQLAGSISNSAVFNLAGGVLDATYRTSDKTLTLRTGQTLKGNGTLTVTGNLTNDVGTVELKVNKAGGVVTNDKLSVSLQLSCSGILKLDLTGEALNGTDVLTVFAAGGYTGSLPTIVPAQPAPGATWDTSTLLTDGKLRIQGPLMLNRPVMSTSGITFSGFGGTASGTFSVLTSTNVAAPAAEWTTLQTGSFDASGNFSVSVPVTSGEPRRFYKLQMP